MLSKLQICFFFNKLVSSSKEMTTDHENKSTADWFERGGELIFRDIFREVVAHAITFYMCNNLCVCIHIKYPTRQRRVNWVPSMDLQ